MKAGGVLPAGAGEVVVQGEDLGAWIVGQRVGWDKLVPVQQYLLETIGVEPAGEGETLVPVRRSQGDRWATNLAAARQFHAREGHLQPARKHVETVDGEEIKLGSLKFARDLGHSMVMPRGCVDAAAWSRLG
ncbi:hypothetical protein [Streptomyces sp. NPDC087859]|uniref:hypothetical protein n=1 Tax=Streptomyces sp. NPDC087859 TaxID=3365812 RepID=UPI0038220160